MKNVIQFILVKLIEIIAPIILFWLFIDDFGIILVYYIFIYPLLSMIISIYVNKKIIISKKVIIITSIVFYLFVLSVLFLLLQSAFETANFPF
jgi:hypothetical protein